MSKFKVKLPNGKDCIIKYAKEYTFDERLCFVFDLLSKPYEECVHKKFTKYFGKKCCKFLFSLLYIMRSKFVRETDKKHL